MNPREIRDLLGSSREVTAPIVHPREVAALIESLGYNDRYAKQSGFPDIFSLAEHLFARLPQAKPAAKVDKSGELLSLWAETRKAMRKFSLSLAYAIPWMVMLALECLRPDALQVSAEIGGALSLSLIASLISAGGFVQMISRSGNFYYGLKEPVVAHRSCMSILNIGLTSSLFLALMGIVFGSYFQLFTAKYLALAAINYLVLSVLWMFCAVLSVQGIGWCIPLSFALSIGIGCLIKILTDPGAVFLLVLCPVLAVLFAFACVQVGSYYAERQHAGNKGSAQPRFAVMLTSLVPFYIYGTVYFSFLFADRLNAGSAVPWASGLSFGIDAAYKKGTDLVLLAFLVTAALVEYLGDSFLRFWQRLAAELPQTAREQLIVRLQKRHSTSMVAIFTVFVVTALGALIAFSRLGSFAPVPRLLQTAAFAGLGYLVLSLALLETIILVSVNAIRRAVLAVGLGVGVNLITGYGLSHLGGVQYAAVGLLAGSAVVLWKCNVAVRQVLHHPDYRYSIS